MILSIPREIIGTTGKLANSQFMVLVGPEEVDYKDISNPVYNILGLTIPANTTKIETFSFGRYNQDLPPYG